MNRIITYTLRNSERSSDEYYRASAAFADRWLTDTLPRTKTALAGFRASCQEAGREMRSDAEYAFEMLALGVLLREHRGELSALPGWMARTLARLVEAQEHWPQVEGPVKVLRGFLGWMARSRPAQAHWSDEIAPLIAWLRANGEGARAARLAEWEEFCAALEPRSAQALILRCLALASDFAEQSLLDLGKYTACVPGFLSQTAPHYRKRYDASLITRSRLEYHLGMLGTEILNRAYRQRFLAARRKVVILPPCMRARGDEECQAVEMPFGARCGACTPSCRVHQVTRLGQKRGFEVYIIPDELHVFGAGTAQGDLGLVGVSCVLTNWSGGWEADALGVPAQGVLLDYVGCRYHWDEHGFPTDVNLKKLQEVLGV